MKTNRIKQISLLLALAISLTALFTGCGQRDEQGGANTSSDESQAEIQTPASDASTESSSDVMQEPDATELIVRFGDAGGAFTLHLYDNDTAAALARHVGTADWRLPIYHYDDYENWEVMQYYDIPSRYEIPSNPESITSEQAGTVYYSEPNRIVLFYQDAGVSGEYTPVGFFDFTEEFLTAVEENPVLEGWGNKIVRISDSE